MKETPNFYYYTLLINFFQETQKDLLVSNQPPIDFSAFKFFSNLLAEKKAAIVEVFDKLPDGVKSDDCTNLVRNFQLSEEHIQPLDFYYSPLCPYSRAVWLFCLEAKIPLNLHKIDLLKEDHSLDNEYKKFSQISTSMKVPLLVDRDLVLEER
jgi:hypothetical protein